MKAYIDIKQADRKTRIRNLLKHPDLTAKQKEVMKDFYEFIIEKALRTESQKAYLQNLRLLFRDLDNALKPSKKDVSKYLRWVGNNLKPKTETERRKFLIMFYTWHMKKNKEEIDFLKNIKINKDKNRKLPEELLTPDEIKKMVAVADNFRDKCIIILLYETATRKGEFLQLKIKHIDIQEDNKKKYGFIHIPAGKTNSRKLPIIYSTPHVINWLNAHPHRDNVNTPLFVTIGAWKGRAFGEDGLKRMLKIVAVRAGIKKNVYPHLLRHSRLTELAKELTEQELKKFAGWTEGSDMASIYVHLSMNDVQNKVLSNAGLIDVKETRKGDAILMQTECPSCKKLNASDNKLCSFCGRVLSLKVAQKEIEQAKKKDTAITKRLDYLEKLMMKALKKEGLPKLKSARMIKKHKLNK